MKKLTVLLLSFITLALQAQEADFRLMSFNMERGDLGVKHGRGWDVRAPGALAMFRHDNPDLLGVQECNSIQRDDILSTMPYKHIGVAVDGLAGEHPTSGNYIFYKPEVFDLLDEGRFWYSFYPDSVGVYTWIAQKPRNAIWGKFRHKASGKEFLYINNHWQNGVDAVINRSMTIMELLSKMRELNPEGLPMIFTGDLNSKGIESYYAPLRQELKHAVDVCPVTDHGITHGGYKRKTGTDGQIDHIYFSGALEGLVFAVDRDAYEGVEHLSDHFPIFCDLRFLESAPVKEGPYWFDLKTSEGDYTLKAGTWNLFSTKERDERGAPSWKSVKDGVVEVIASLGTDLLGLQEMTEPMLRDLQKMLKARMGKGYKLWAAFSDPNPETPGREAIGLLYNADRFSLSRQTQSWIRAGESAEPAKPWGDDYRCILTAVVKDKKTGRRFFVLTGKGCKGKNPVKYEGNVIKTIEKDLNKEGLPCLLLWDMNTNPRGNVWISLLNYWTDTYALMYPFADTVFSTRIGKEDYQGNTPKDWSTRFDIVGINRYVENGIIVTENTVHRETRDMNPVPSDHYPVTATLVFTK